MSIFKTRRPAGQRVDPKRTGPRKGELFSATVRDLASDGRGVVSHPNGLTVFVPGVWPGEAGSFRFTGMQNRVGSAEVVDLEQPSEHRAEPACSHHGFKPGDCGACPWQFVDYKAQLAAKQRRLDVAAARITDTPVQTIWPSRSVYGYRNRAQLKTDGERLGYVTAGSHSLAAIEDCPILTDKNRQTLGDLRARLPEPAWRPIKKVNWTSLDIDESIEADSVSINSRLSFQQSNTTQNQRMKDWLAEKCASLDKSVAVLELFCGSGNFTEVLSRAGFQTIVAVDASGPATRMLSERQWPNVTVLTQDLFDTDSYAALFRRQKHYSTLVLDPPRDGMRHLNTFLSGRSKPEQIFYISCNPATLFRDLSQLQAMSYHIAELQPLDQAPHTPHVETLVHLTLSRNVSRNLSRKKK